MRFTIALDERNGRDVVFEAQGVPFLIDPFTATLVREGLRVDYDAEYDSFSVWVPGLDSGAC